MSYHRDIVTPRATPTHSASSAHNSRSAEIDEETTKVTSEARRHRKKQVKRKRRNSKSRMSSNRPPTQENKDGDTAVPGSLRDISARRRVQSSPSRFHTYASLSSLKDMYSRRRSSADVRANNIDPSSHPYKDNYRNVSKPYANSAAPVTGPTNVHPSSNSRLDNRAPIFIGKDYPRSGLDATDDCDSTSCLDLHQDTSSENNTNVLRTTRVNLGIRNTAKSKRLNNKTKNNISIIQADKAPAEDIIHQEMSNLHLYSSNGGSNGSGANSNSGASNNDPRRFPIVKLGSVNSSNSGTGGSSTLSSASGQKVSGNRYDGSNNSPAMFKYSQIFQRKSAGNSATGSSGASSSQSQYGHPYHNSHNQHHHHHGSTRNHDLPVYVDRISSIQALRRSLFQPDSETSICGGSAVDSAASVHRGIGFQRSTSCQSSTEARQAVKPKSILKQRRRPGISKQDASRQVDSSDQQQHQQHQQQPQHQSLLQHRQSTGKHERSVHFALPNANRCRTLRKFVCF